MKQNLKFIGINKIDFTGIKTASVFVEIALGMDTEVEILGHGEEDINIKQNGSLLNLQEVENQDNKMKILISDNSKGISSSVSYSSSITIKNVGNSSISTFNGKVVQTEKKSGSTVVVKVPKGTEISFTGSGKLSIGDIEANVNLDVINAEIKAAKVKNLKLKLSKSSADIVEVNGTTEITAVDDSTIKLSNGTISELTLSCFSSDFTSDHGCSIQNASIRRPRP